MNRKIRILQSYRDQSVSHRTPSDFQFDDSKDFGLYSIKGKSKKAMTSQSAEPALLVEVESSMTGVEQAIPKRQPKCARCRNHGEIVNVKDHKPCPYRDCQSPRCDLIVERRRISAAQIALGRLQARQIRLGRSSNVSLNDMMSLNYFSKTAGGISPQDISHLQANLSKVISHFSQFHQSTSFINTLYLTILRDNNFDYETVITKILEGDKEYRKMGWSLTNIKSTPPPTNTTYHWPNLSAASNSPSTSSPLLAGYPNCYSSFLQSSYPLYSHNNIMGALPAHAMHHSIESVTAPNAPYPLYYPGIQAAFTTSPPSATSAVSDLVSGRTYSPIHRQLTEGGHTSGDSRGSAEYKDESDKESGGRREERRRRPEKRLAPAEESPPTTEPKRVKSFHPYQVQSWQERMETAA